MNKTPSSNNVSHEADDGLLDNVLTSIRSESVPERPSDFESWEATPIPAAHRENVSVANQSNEKRRVGWPLFVSAAVLLMAVTALVWSSMIPPAYGEVKDAIRAARTVRFTLSTYHNEGKPNVTQVWIDDAVRFCATTKGPETNVLEMMDLERKIKLELDHVQRKAVVMELKPDIDTLIRFEHDVRKFEDVPENAAEYVGKSVIDGRKVDEFTLRLGNSDHKVFVDPETDLPVRAELVKSDAAGQERFREVHSGFAFDCELDPKLFDVTNIPEGYEVKTIRFGELPPEDEGLVVSPEKGLNVLPFGSTVEKAIAMFGQPSENGTFHRGRALSYNSRGMTLMFVQDKGLVKIDCHSQLTSGPFVTDFAGATSKGIKIGSIADEVVAAYGKSESGEPESSGNSQLYYARKGLRFHLFDGRVQDIFVTKPKPR